LQLSWPQRSQNTPSEVSEHETLHRRHAGTIEDDMQAGRFGLDAGDLVKQRREGRDAIEVICTELGGHT
jgi:hypothetical protein